MCKNYHGGEKWIEAVIKKKLFSVTYEMGIDDGRVYGRDT